MRSPRLSPSPSTSPSPLPSPALSLRNRLLLGIGVPVLALMVFNAVGLYRQALAAADTAYDRTLLASAKAIGELLEVEGEPGAPRLRGNLTYAALEAFEADNRSRLYYRVRGFQGEMVSGFADLPAPRPDAGRNEAYAALVDFYDEQYRGEPVRMAVLLQPVAGAVGQGMATIQVAETLPLRRTLARQLLLDTLWRQGALLAVLVLVIAVVVRQATRPLLRLSDELARRDETDLSPLTISPRQAAPELQPIVEATNGLMARVAHLVAHQKRFVRDASHQLRTPLAVLKTQLQSAQRGDLPAAQALAEISSTVERATELANQMLALAKVEQLRQQGGAPVVDAEAIVRAVALDIAPLAAERQLDFGIDTATAVLRAHEWALRELTRNLLHNAVKHSPLGARLTLGLRTTGAEVELTVEDEGPGIDGEMRQRLFQPFATATAPVTASGSGLGLAICHEIVTSLGGRIVLENRAPAAGLRCRVWLPCVAAAGSL